MSRKNHSETPVRAEQFRQVLAFKKVMEMYGYEAREKYMPFPKWVENTTQAIENALRDLERQGYVRRVPGAAAGLEMVP